MHDFTWTGRGTKFIAFSTGGKSIDSSSMARLWTLDLIRRRISNTAVWFGLGKIPLVLGPSRESYLTQMLRTDWD